MNGIEARQCAERLWDEYCAGIRADKGRRAEAEGHCIVFGEVKMHYTLEVVGKPGQEGYPVYIALHGGGGSSTPDMNNRQWKHMGSYYRDGVENGIYVCPRGVRDTWDTHANPESYPLYDRLIENLIVFHRADPNRVYLLGFSAGGDGVYLAGPRLADRFAALHMSAGHPNKNSLVNLYHTPIQLQVGMNDWEYDRNHETVRYQMYLDRLRTRNPEGYVRNVYVHTEKPHNFQDNTLEHQEVLIDNISWLHGGLVTRRRVDANAVHFLDNFVRNPLPERVIWELDARRKAKRRSVESFYWLRIPGDIKKGKAVVRLDREANAILVERNDTGGNTTVLLKDGMLNLDRPITVLYPDGRKETCQAARSEEVMRRTLAERGDPYYMFSVEIALGRQKEK